MSYKRWCKHRYCKKIIPICNEILDSNTLIELPKYITKFIELLEMKEKNSADEENFDDMEIIRENTYQMLVKWYRRFAHNCG